MQSLSTRMATLEKSIGVDGRRPAGMSDREFLRYLGEMPRPQHRLFTAAMSIEDIRTILEAGILLLKDEMPPELYKRFRHAREAHDFDLSLNIFRGYIEEKRRAGSQ